MGRRRLDPVKLLRELGPIVQCSAVEYNETGGLVFQTCERSAVAGSDFCGAHNKAPQRRRQAALQAVLAPDWKERQLAAIQEERKKRAVKPAAPKTEAERLREIRERGRRGAGRRNPRKEKSR